MLLHLLVVPVLLGGAPSDTLRARADSVREYRGVYEAGFEVSWFHACDAEPCRGGIRSNTDHALVGATVRRHTIHVRDLPP